MKKGQDCGQNKWNIFMIICDTDILQQLTSSCWQLQNFRSGDFNLTAGKS